MPQTDRSPAHPSGDDRASEIAFAAELSNAENKPNQTKFPSVRAKLKRGIVRLAVGGLIPLSIADALIRRGRLTHD